MKTEEERLDGNAPTKRNLYKVVGVIEDKETNNSLRITHCFTKEKSPKHICLMLTDTKLPSGDTVWDDMNQFGETPSSSVLIFTLIGTNNIANKMLVRIPFEWDLSDKNYHFLERSGQGTGFPLLFRPICPKFEGERITTNGKALKNLALVRS